MGSFVDNIDSENLSPVGFNKELYNQVELASFLDRVIFEEHDNAIFGVLEKSDKVYKYKYPNGDLLIDRVLLNYKNSLFGDDIYLSNYYARIVFDILKRDDYKNKRVNSVVEDLRKFKSKLNRKEMSKNIMILIDKLEIISSNSISNVEEKEYLKRLEHSYSIRSNFSSSIESIDKLKNSCNNIIDMRDKNIITMDYKYKATYDDAISFEKLKSGNYLLGVYITDVASFVGMDTLLYEHAKQRGESIYGNMNNTFYLPMFPREITKDFFSLNSGEDKYVIAHMFEFSELFDLVGYGFYNALINVKKNYSFENINRMNNTDSNYDMVCMLKRLSDSLQSDFNSKYHLFKEYGKKNVKHYENGAGSNIITNVTVFLNTFIAEMFKHHNYPFIYRINESLDCYISDFELKKIIKGSSISSYSLNSLPHPVNGGKAYGHITNPIRSFASYINQYIFLNTFIDWNNNKDILKIMKFNDSISQMLPDLVSELNKRLYLNDEFLDVLTELNDRCSVTKCHSKCKKTLTRRR